MEVHHHPHVEKKNFKEYFLEFLMIFLAVTMGFFAENVREHFSDKEKEQQYLKSFVADLKIDEKKLPRLIEAIEKQQIEPADSLPYLLRQATVKAPANKIYYSLRNMIRQQGIKIFVTDRTIEEVKNAGVIRLITDKDISDSLIDYYKLIDYAAYLQMPLQEMKAGLVQNLRLILNGYDYAKMIDSSDQIIHPDEILHLRSVDQDAINRCLMSISEINGLSITIRGIVREILHEAASIKNMINKRYDFGSE